MSVTARRGLLAVAVVLALVAAGPVSSAGPGQVRDVTMPGRVFAPGRIQVLLGDTVLWRNADGTNHTVTSDDDLFDSGFIAPGLTFAEAFARTGKFAYHCSIHKFMRGEVVVVPVALTAPAEPVIAGGKIVLQGFAPTGTSRVIVNRLGSDRQVVGRVAPAGDGSFTLSLRVLRRPTQRAREGARQPARPHSGRAARARAPERRHRFAVGEPEAAGSAGGSPALRARALRLANGLRGQARRVVEALVHAPPPGGPLPRRRPRQPWLGGRDLAHRRGQARRG